MTEQQLAEIEARANAAELGRKEVAKKLAGRCNWSGQCSDAQTEFERRAYTDVPALVAEVRRLRALIEYAKGEDGH